MHEWPIDRDLDEQLRDLVFAEVAAAEPRQIAFRPRPARRGSLAGAGIAAAAVIVLVAALVLRPQSAPVNGGPSVSPTATPMATLSAVPSTPTTPIPNLTPGPTADPAATPVKTPACWVDGYPVVLSDGRLLYAQGRSCNLVFDPATRTFALVGPMNEDRIGSLAALLKDGRVLIAGGIKVAAGEDALPFEVFDPKTGRFTPIGPDGMPAAIDLLSLPDGRVLILGGPHDSVSAQLTAEIFDPTRSTFTAAGSLPLDAATPDPPPVSADLLGNGKVLVVELDPGKVARTEIYDPAAGTFTPTAGSALVRPIANFLTAGLPDGRVMLLGGGSTVVEAYNPPTDAFTRLASIPNADVLATTTLTDGRVLAIASVASYEGADSGLPKSEAMLFDRRPSASSSRITSNATVSHTLMAEIYDPARNRWTDLGQLKGDRYYVELAPLPGGGAIVSGTTPGGMGVEVVELFDPRTNKFTENL